MKKLWIAICLLFLVGCQESASPIQGALDFRTELLQQDAIAFSGEAVAHFGEKSYEFAVDCQYDIDTGDSRVEITKPEELAGIVATTTQGDETLIYEDVVLALDCSQPSAMLLAKLFGDGWCNGYIQCSDKENTTTIQLSDWEDMTLVTYFDESNVPYFCEIYQGTTCILTATIQDFNLQ